LGACRGFESEWLDEGARCGGRTGCREAVDIEASRHVLKSAFEAFDVGVKLADVVLEPLDPALLLTKALTTFFLAVADELRNIVGQPLIFHVIDVGEGGADGSDDGWGEGSRM